MNRCHHEPALTERGGDRTYVKKCMACGLHTRPHETVAGVEAEWKVRLALDKHLHGDVLSAQDEVVLAYGYHASVCGQRLV